MVALNQLSAEGYSYNQITSQLNNLTNKTKDETANNWAQRGDVYKRQTKHISAP